MKKTTSKPTATFQPLDTTIIRNVLKENSPHVLYCITDERTGMKIDIDAFHSLNKDFFVKSKIIVHYALGIKQLIERHPLYAGNTLVALATKSISMNDWCNSNGLFAGHPQQVNSNMIVTNFISYNERDGYFAHPCGWILTAIESEQHPSLYGYMRFCERLKTDEKYLPVIMKYFVSSR